MPSTLPSSFASAAAGGNLENGVNRRDGSGGNEWSRSRPNGATQTFRRTSQATTQSRENIQQPQSASSAGPYIPPHLNQTGTARNGSSDARYTKEQMLAIYRSQKETRTLDRNIDQLFQGPWDYASRNGLTSSKDGKDQPGPEVCWNASNDGDPFGMVDMSDAERQLYITSVNSPVKLTQNKEGGSNTGGARKPSISNHHATGYNASGGTSGRPTARRRETSESFTANGPLSPIETKTFFRNEPNANTPPSLLRRRTDYQEEDGKTENKDTEFRGEGESDNQTPFPPLRRLATGPLSAGLNGPSTTSPWSAAPGGPRSAFDTMGSFGSFAVGGSPVVQDAEKRPGFGSARGGSRFKDLLAKTSTEDMSPSVKEKASFGALGKLPEEDPNNTPGLRDIFKTRPNRSETNPYDEGMPRSGSAALSQDEQGIEQMGFSSFAANSGQPEAQGTPHGRRTNDPLSPSNTNPYQSPSGGRPEEEEGHEHAAQATGHQPFGSARRDVFSGGLDRNQAGFGAPRAGLGGFGSVPGWGPSAFASNTPGRDRPMGSAPFGENLFAPISGLQSPGGHGMGADFFGNPVGPAGRPNRLGALFPPAMQDQMRSENRNDAFESTNESRDPFDGARRQESFRNLFDDNHPQEGRFSPQPGAPPQASIGPPGAAQRNSAGPEQPLGHGMSQSSGSSGSNTLPAAQQRQMVMPDRMRWIYRDPQGNVQGPWSGLEMHDWFKAGFFTAELQVKKLEDSEYEPLAQLVRRIGNSREPFLVPQIGIPHGTPSNQGNHWATNMGTTGGTQPPFANSFPSFGTTLTAEQQNALERRKQEEQYLMARQKEHLAQQQMYMKQMQMQNPSSGFHALQHHSSAHSLHSQPSFGSIASPSGYQQSPMQAPIQPPQGMHGFGHGSGPGSGQQHAAQDDLPGLMDRMNFPQRGGQFTGSPIGTQPLASGAGGTYHERSRQAGENRQAEARAHEEAFLGLDGRNERLEEFQDLRDQYDHDQEQVEETPLPHPIGAQRPSEEPSTIPRAPATAGQQMMSVRPVTAEELENLSLLQQVQRTAAANEKAAADEVAIQPPPVSISPLPAPAAQRNRQHVADALAAGSRSPTQTPAIETPTSSSVAPWADKTADVPKGPSLKEIQEAEAKRAAEQEEVLAAARRAQVEQERMAAAAMPPPAPGLPSTSTWASMNAATSPGPASSVWQKQGAKPAVTIPAGPKKTLAQIQKEEEARKNRAAAQAAAQAQQTASYSAQQAAVAGKRYAELASKVIPSASPTTGGAWTTVGSGGAKAKTPATVVATPNTASRTVSTGNVATATPVKRPVVPVTRTTSVSSQSKANDEFVKWVKLQLGAGLNSGINVDNFVQNLLILPPEIDIIRDSIYASSQTIHGGHFAEEFVRRRKLADKGIVEPSSDAGSPGPATDSKSGAGGWNEVAKKGPAKEESSNNAAFKVVAKKKGRK